jgi:hypothetical protein
VKARTISRRKEFRDDGAIVEVAIFELPEPLHPSVHRYKYRLAYVVNGVCVLRYDNERGKGDHRHLRGRESVYRFTDLETLLADFEKDAEKLK